MNQNVGDTDVIVRYLLAVVFIFLGIMFNYPLLFLLTLYFVASAFFGWCLIYGIFRINTCKPKELQSTTIPTMTQPMTLQSIAASPSTPSDAGASTISSNDQVDTLMTENHPSLPMPRAKPKSRPKKAKPKKAVKKTTKKKKR